METVQTKPWYMSKTIWAAIVTAIIGVTLEVSKNAFGVDLGSNQMVGWVLMLLSAIGIYGRSTATTALTK